MLELTNTTINWLKNTANQLKGSVRRVFMAETVRMLGFGGASAAEAELGWNRGTIRKGQQEVETCAIEDNFSARGRKKSDMLFPHLLDDIKKIADPESQTDPSFNSCRLYTRLTAKEILTEKIYETGVKVSKKAMEKYNALVERMSSLEKGSVSGSLGYSG